MLKILDPGIYTSVQDQGRFGYRKYGVPVSGAMDQDAYILANKLVGTPLNEAVIEFAFVGPKIEFLEDCQIVLTGATFNTFLDDKELSIHIPIAVTQGQVLEIKNAREGCYGYLGIAGKWNSQFVMGSKSQYSNITSSPRLQKNDIVKIVPSNGPINRYDIQKEPPKTEIEVVKGPEFDQVKGEKKFIFNAEFSISKNLSRMGIKLDSSIQLSAKEIITSPVMPGVIQLTPGGEFIALMRDAQTTGGYARVLILPDKSINHLSQLKPGSKFTFKLA